MKKSEMAEVMDQVFKECGGLREAGQQEYAHKDEEAFANFNRVAERLGIDRKAVLMVYAEKHIDGIHSFIKGHKSQREDVRGRINDVIVYMCLLRGMIEEDQTKEVLGNMHDDLNKRMEAAAGLNAPLSKISKAPDVKPFHEPKGY